MTNGIRFSLVSVFLLYFGVSMGQAFRNHAAIESVSKSGYYRIRVTPALSSYLKPDFRDLFIEDANGKAVPYIVKSGLPVLLPDQRVRMKILSNELKDSGRSVLILNNESLQKINGFTLLIKNAAISRSARISGSDDRLHWYSVAENISFEKRWVTNQDAYLEDVSFPLSSYHYFRLIIENGKNDPLNIISAGRYLSGTKVPTVPVVENPESRFIQTDSSDRSSYLRIMNPAPFHINYIELRVSRSGFFKRPADILVRNELYGSFTFSSDKLFRFQLPVFQTKDWQIRIFNGDNPPLKIAAVRTWQEPKEIFLYLDSGANYQMKMTSDLAKQARYDLQNYSDSLSPDLPVVNISAIKPVAAVHEKKSLFSGNWLWPTMFGILGLLLFFTMKLTREIPNKK